MPADTPAPELIRRCRAGEEAARAELLTRYRHYLHVLAEAQLGRHLPDVLTRLPENYQRVLLLRLFEGLPSEEVAERMNTTAGAVRMLQMRALAALRTEMKNEE